MRQSEEQFQHSLKPALGSFHQKDLLLQMIDYQEGFVAYIYQKLLFRGHSWKKNQK